MRTTAFINRIKHCVRRIQPRRHVQHGQALVELALSISVIMLLLAAAVDLGLAFKTYQTLVNATAEASSYLVLYPSVSCSAVGIAGSDPIACADAVARKRFQTEQGDQLTHGISTMDLDDDGVKDADSLVQQWVQIDEADNRQIDPTGTTFAANATFKPSQTDPECQAREANPSSTNTSVHACYIVIRSQITYKPFVLRAVLGDSMTIRAISVRQIK